MGRKFKILLPLLYLHGNICFQIAFSFLIEFKKKCCNQTILGNFCHVATFWHFCLTFLSFASFYRLFTISQSFFNLYDDSFIIHFSGWQEVHQACRNGLVAHLEQLLYYGAELNARNASGNTPLHVCAVNNQESCTRTLLFRGADKNALNFAGQTPYQVRQKKLFI